MKTKPCNRCGRTFDQGHLKNCSAMGKTCKNCGKPNHFAKLCRSQQVSEVAEDSEGSVEECDQISEKVGSCSEFEVMSIQTYQPENERVSKYVKDRINEMRNNSNEEMIRVQKKDSIRDPTLKRVKITKDHGTNRQPNNTTNTGHGKPSFICQLGDNEGNHG